MKTWGARNGYDYLVDRDDFRPHGCELFHRCDERLRVRRHDGRNIRFDGGDGIDDGYLAVGSEPPHTECLVRGHL